MHMRGSLLTRPKVAGPPRPSLYATDHDPSLFWWTVARGSRARCFSHQHAMHSTVRLAIHASVHESVVRGDSAGRVDQGVRVQRRAGSVEVAGEERQKLDQVEVRESR